MRTIGCFVAVVAALCASTVDSSVVDVDTTDIDMRTRTHENNFDENSHASTTAEGLHFLAIGDWGGREWWPYTTLAQVRTASGMARVATAQNSTFVLALGDNFYSHGQATPQRFAATYEKAYHQKSLQIPWYVVAGNHDHLGNVTAQLDYHSMDGRWNFPSLFYTVKKKFVTTIVGPDGQKNKKTMEAEFVMIDTVVLAGINALSDSSHPSYFDPLAGPRSADESTQYLRWIDQRLAKSTADYLFVAGHYPVYSACSHGNTEYLIDRLEPLMKKHGVTAYLSGHEHCALHVERDDLDYILTGTGDECCYEGSNVDGLPDDADLRYLLSEERNPSGAVGGFASFASAADGQARLDVAYRDQGGKELYSTSLYPRKNVGGGASSDMEEER